MRPSRWLLAVVLPSAVALAGCGGGGDGESTVAAPVTTATTASLSKEELIAQGDAICAEVNAAVGTVGSTSSSTTSQAGQVAQLYSGMVERLQGLGTPSDDTAGYSEFIAAAEQLSQAESDVSLAAGRGEEGTLQEAEADAASALSSFQAAAQSYGFKECGEAPSAPTPGSGSEEASEESSEGEVEEEAAPEVEEEVAPETGGAGAGEEGGGATAGEEAGGTESSGGSSSGGIGPG